MKKSYLSPQFEMVSIEFPAMLSGSTAAVSCYCDEINEVYGNPNTNNLNGGHNPAQCDGDTTVTP